MLGNSVNEFKTPEIQQLRAQKTQQQSYAKEATVFLESVRKQEDLERKILKPACTHVRMIKYCNTAAPNISLHQMTFNFMKSA